MLVSCAKLNTLYNAVVAYLLGYRRPLLYIEVLEYVAGKYKPIIESGVCPWCGREYRNPSSLRYHIIRVHGRNLDQLVYEALHIIMACKRGTKVYNGQLKCRYCGKRFRYVSELRKHIIREHPEHLKKLEDAKP